MPSRPCTMTLPMAAPNNSSIPLFLFASFNHVAFPTSPHLIYPSHSPALFFVRIQNQLAYVLLYPLVNINFINTYKTTTRMHEAWDGMGWDWEGIKIFVTLKRETRKPVHLFTSRPLTSVHVFFWFFCSFFSHLRHPSLRLSLPQPSLFPPFLLLLLLTWGRDSHVAILRQQQQQPSEQ